MTSSNDISFSKYMWSVLSYKCCLFVAAILLFGQAVSASHSHEHIHHDEAPIHSSCEICVLAVNDEGDLNIVLDFGFYDDVAEKWATQYNYSALLGSKDVPSPVYNDLSIHPPPSPNLRPDAARAPPSIS